MTSKITNQDTLTKVLMIIKMASVKGYIYTVLLGHSNALLLQGNLKFTDSGDHADIEDKVALDTIAGLLGTDTEKMTNAMCYRVVATHHEVMHKRHTGEVAAYGKDALAKVTLYVCSVCVRACVCAVHYPSLFQFFF